MDTITFSDLKQIDPKVLDYAATRLQVKKILIILKIKNENFRALTITI